MEAILSVAHMPPPVNARRLPSRLIRCPESNRLEQSVGDKSVGESVGDTPLAFGPNCSVFPQIFGKLTQCRRFSLAKIAAVASTAAAK